MKKKNGFTLIELLAVIVILAIIALIAVPIIMNVINEAKKGAAKDSMYGYVEAIELEIAKAMLTDQNLLTGEYTTKTGDLYSGSTKALSVSFKGSKPDDNGTVTLTNGRVTKAELTFGGHSVTYNGTKVENDEEVKIYKKYENGTAIYYNPVSGTKCNQNEAVSTTGTKTGCMKWYAFLDSETSAGVSMILDHNTTAIVRATSPQTFSVMEDALATDTSNWKAGLNPRFIKAEEIGEIVGNSDFISNTSATLFEFDQQGTPTYTWLYDHTKNCSNYGCTVDNTTYGYWTSTPLHGAKVIYWFVVSGRISGSSAGIYETVVTHGSNGIRPVITVAKTALEV